MNKINGMILIFTFFLLLSQVSFAQEDTSSKGASLATMSSSMIKEEYLLPYPGLLPDNPLYVLKTARDRIIGFLIADPLKKAEFDLLQADKRLNAAVFLLKEGKGKEELAETTISKGENYFEEAITSIKEAGKQGLNTESVKRRLLTASQKHKEVLKYIINKSSKDKKKLFESLEKRVETIQNQVMTLTPKQ